MKLKVQLRCEHACHTRDQEKHERPPSASGAPCENGQPQAPLRSAISLCLPEAASQKKGLRYSRMRLARQGLPRPLIPAVADEHCLRVRSAKVGSRWTIWPQEDIIREVSSEFAGHCRQSRLSLRYTDTRFQPSDCTWQHLHVARGFRIGSPLNRT